MLRKHINSMSQAEIDRLPFHAWQCITISLGDQVDIDLVVVHDADMDLLLANLVLHMKTIDGEQGSANQYLRLLQK